MIMGKFEIKLFSDIVPILQMIMEDIKLIFKKLLDSLLELKFGSTKKMKNEYFTDINIKQIYRMQPSQQI